MSNESLTGYLNEVIHWTWDKFLKFEKDPSLTGVQAVVLDLVRKCAERDFGAIKLAVDRVDGKIKTPVEIIYPKVYLQYPYATKQAALPKGVTKQKPNKKRTKPKQKPKELASLSLREALQKMAESPRQLPDLVIRQKELLEGRVQPTPEEQQNSGKIPIPMVKSVIVANFLIMARGKRGMEVVYELFDQLDGKLVETVEILGSDIYITKFDSVAPAQAYLNKKKVFELVSESVTSQWEKGFEKKRNM